MKDFKDKVAVVIGAASGIGRGTAATFVAAGMKVVLSDIEQRPLEETTRLLLAAGPDVHARADRRVNISYSQVGRSSLFRPDRSPVVGYDPHRPGFSWLATLGGYGIQIAASLVLDLNLVEDLLARGINLRELSPSRLMPNREEINIVVEHAG